MGNPGVTEILETWSRWTDFCLEIEIAKMKIFIGIRNNLAKEEIQKVINWDTDDWVAGRFSDDSYCEACSRVVMMFSDFDSDSSSARGEMYRFISDACQFLADQNKAQIKQIKLDQIKKLQKEIEKLEEELP